MKTTILYIFLLFCLLLTACGSGAVGQPEAQPVSPAAEKFKLGSDYEPVFEALDECPFEAGMFPPDMLHRECGYLVVPEDRSLKDSPDIKIAVAIYRATGEDPKPDPLLILVSNPSGQVAFSPVFGFTLPELQEQRDFIVMDTRGTGFSQPSFQCPQVNDYYYAHLNQDPLSQSYQDGYTEALNECRKQWALQSDNLAAYSTQAAAADIEDLRTVLNIDEWNILGVAYGSRLVYTLLRDYPTGIRSAVVDVIEPLNGDTFTGKGLHTEAILKLFFTRCAEDEHCKAAYPDLERVFYQLLDQLNNKPQVVDARDLQSGGVKPMYLDGNTLVNLVVAAMGNNIPDVLPELPRVIYQARGGDTQRLSEMMGQLINYNAPQDIAMQTRIYCVERVQYLDADKVRQSDARGDPRVAEANAKNFALTQQACEVVYGDLYEQGTALETVEFSNNVPLLVLNGEQNAFTIPAWAKQAAGDQGVLVEVASMGIFDWLFGGGQSVCIKPLVKGFLDDPNVIPNEGCVKERQDITWITFQ